MASMESVDMSLDDIIKLNKKKTVRTVNKTNKPNLGRLKNIGNRSGIVRKGGPRQASIRQSQQTHLTTRKEPTMIHISNLHYAVSNNDISELFSSKGVVKKASVHYDKSGRSLGTAEVLFASRDGAINAIKEFQGVPLDGRPLKIALLPNPNSSVRSPTKARMGVKPGSGIRKRAPPTKVGPTPKGRAAGGVRKGKPFQRGQRQPRQTVTAEELDADLEAYSTNAKS